MNGNQQRPYDSVLARAAELYPGVRVGRPGRARSYWLTVALLRVLRLRLAVRIVGGHHVAPGAAVLIGNHVSALDPVVVVMSTWWRVTAFTKVEWFAGRGAVFFRWMGQIPLRRGDEASTAWAMQMARLTLDAGGKIGLYPEGTRSPNPAELHRLHRRVLVPLLQAVADIPMHVVATSYRSRWGRRRQVEVRVSPALDLDVRAMTADQLTIAVRDALLCLSGQTYVNKYARDVKRR